MISRIKAGIETRVDQTLSDALFLKRNPAFRPEDLGYPPRDAILISLIRELG